MYLEYKYLFQEYFRTFQLAGFYFAVCCKCLRVYSIKKKKIIY